ncbi:hypothetical protein [Mesorhizobium argentiipisi]|uniref:PepSY domain-containing protein n=1 Tax=Mesorhizobium argentiipisi TaxID=3015175 RepID=A0ABU8K7Z5_9HYPH
MKSKLKFWLVLSIVTAIISPACAGGSSLTASAQRGETDAAIVADQIRSQGFPCKGPISAERLDAESVPNETAYLLQCDAKAYRVLLIPDQAAIVTSVG